MNLFQDSAFLWCPNFMSSCSEQISHINMVATGAPCCKDSTESFTEISTMKKSGLGIKLRFNTFYLISVQWIFTLLRESPGARRVSHDFRHIHFTQQNHNKLHHTAIKPSGIESKRARVLWYFKRWTVKDRIFATEMILWTEEWEDKDISELIKSKNYD